jgi:hypothetical protein
MHERWQPRYHGDFLDRREEDLVVYLVNECKRLLRSSKGQQNRCMGKEELEKWLCESIRFTGFFVVEC